MDESGPGGKKKYGWIETRKAGKIMGGPINEELSRVQGIFKQMDNLLQRSVFLLPTKEEVMPFIDYLSTELTSLMELFISEAEQVRGGFSVDHPQFDLPEPKDMSFLKQYQNVFKHYYFSFFKNNKVRGFRDYLWELITKLPEEDRDEQSKLFTILNEKLDSYLRSRYSDLK